MITTVCLIRHGQTDWNKQNIIQGRLNNPLNENGIAQAHEAGELLKRIDPSWDLIMSSPLSRAYDTAKIIASHLDYPKDVIINNDFIERDFGKAEGCDIEKEIYQQIELDNVDGLEKRAELQQRVLNALLDLGKKYPGQKIIVTTHSHVIKGVLTAISSEFNFSTRILNTALNYFYLEDNKVIDYKINIK